MSTSLPADPLDSSSRHFESQFEISNEARRLADSNSSSSSFLQRSSSSVSSFTSDDNITVNVNPEAMARKQVRQKLRGLLDS